MAYQNVNIPRFYVSWGDYWKSLGMPTDKLYTLNPSQNPLLFPSIDAGGGRVFMGNANTPYETAALGINFCAVLGHNLDSEGVHFIAKQIGGGVQDDFLAAGTVQDGVNVEDSTRLSGFTLSTFPEVSNATIPATSVSVGIQNDSSSSVNPVISSFVFGKYYDMQQPDLSVKLSYSYDGIKNIETKGGATLSNAMYTGTPNWGEYGAWQLGDTPNYRNGRKSWDLSFSFLRDSDIMAENAGTALIDGIDTNILDGTDFFSSVWNKTAGLPFIFNPNGGGENPNNNPDQFAICRFDMKSLQLTQVGINLYSCSLKIRESW